MTVDNNTDWRRAANCLGVDPELFFPERGELTETAKAVCHACTVRLECLDYAIVNSEKFGIWGGLSERERRRIRSTRRQAAVARGERPALRLVTRFEHGTNSGYSRHKREGSAPCDDCREAHRLYEQHRTRRDDSA
jgi:WhiB family redox-sensing transcriptional regulator